MTAVRMLRLDESLYDFCNGNSNSYLLRLEGSTLKAEWKWWPTTWLYVWMHTDEYRLPKIMGEINALGKNCIVNSPLKVPKTLTELVLSWRGHNPNRDPFDSSYAFSVEKYIDVDKLQKCFDSVVRKFNQKNKQALQAVVAEKTISLSKKLADHFSRNPEKYEVRSFETPNSPDGLLQAEGCAIHAAVRNNALCADGIREMLRSIFSWARKQKAREISCHKWDEIEQKVFQDLDTLVDPIKSDAVKRNINLDPWKIVLWVKALWEIEEQVSDTMIQEWNSCLDAYAAEPKEFKEYMNGYLFACSTRKECSLFVRERKIRAFNRGANLYLNVWNKNMPHIAIALDERGSKLDDLNIILNDTVDHKFRVYFVEKKKF